MTWNMPPSTSEYGEWVCIGHNAYMQLEDYLDWKYQEMLDAEQAYVEYLVQDENMLDPFYNDELLGVSYVE